MRWIAQHRNRKLFLVESDGHRVVYAEHETGLEIIAMALGAIQAAPIVVGVIKSSFATSASQSKREIGHSPKWRRHELAVEMQKNERGARIPINGDLDDAAFARRFESAACATAKALDQP